MAILTRIFAQTRPVSITGLILLISLLCVTSADPVRVSLLDASQYRATLTSTPTLTGAVVAFTATGDPNINGVDVFISTDLYALLNTTITHDCADLDSKCYQAARDLIISPTTQLDNRLVTRQGTAVFSGVVAMLSILLGFFFKGENDAPPINHIPPIMLSNAADLAAATVIEVDKGNGATVMITPSIPSGPTITAFPAPAIQTFTNSANGHTKGDVDIQLPQDLAQRIQDYLLQTKSDTCIDGSTQSRKRDSSYANALCGAKGIVTNMSPGGPFEDLLLVSDGSFPWTSAELVRATATVADFALELKDMLRLSDNNGALSVAALAFGLSWYVFLNGQKLGVDNIIPAASLQNTNTVSCTASAVRTCEVECGYIGALYQCATVCGGTCATATSSILTTATTTQWNPPTASPTSTLIPKTPACGIHGTISGLPSSVFKGVYDQFCAQVSASPDSPLYWTVDMSGNNIPTLKYVEHKMNSSSSDSRSVDRRTPAPDPKQYEDYRVRMQWAPLKSAGVCPMTCQEALESIATSECGNNGGLAAGIMTTQITEDIGCGKYTVIVIPPPIDMKVGAQQCYDKNKFNTGEDTAEYQVRQFSDMFCDSAFAADAVMHPGDQPISKSWPRLSPGGNLLLSSDLRYEIGWVSGCGAGGTMSLKNPVGSLQCSDILFNNYKNCNNDGQGGSITVGCLTYDFRPIAN